MTMCMSSPSQEWIWTETLTSCTEWIYVPNLSKQESWWFWPSMFRAKILRFKASTLEHSISLPPPPTRFKNSNRRVSPYSAFTIQNMVEQTLCNIPARHYHTSLSCLLILGSSISFSVSWDMRDRNLLPHDLNLFWIFLFFRLLPCTMKNTNSTDKNPVAGHTISMCSPL